MPSHRFFGLIAGLSCLALGGCEDGPPSGQVIAAVNGQEITMSELNHEARVRNLPIDTNPALRQALIQELVERELLVLEARARDVGQTPEFVLAERRSRDILLVQELLAGAAGAGPISNDDVRRFIARHPLSFAGRVAARAEQFGITAPVEEGLRRQLASARSPQEIAALLEGAGIAFTRSVIAWDSADPMSPLGRGDVPARKGQAFVLAADGGLVAGIVTDLQPQPVPAEQQDELARALIRRAESEQRMSGLLDQARARSSIVYQKGFEPGAGGANATGHPADQR